MPRGQYLKEREMSYLLSCRCRGAPWGHPIFLAAFEKEAGLGMNP